MRKLLVVLPLLSLMGAQCGSPSDCSITKGSVDGTTILTCSDGSKATVAPEPAGTNCPYGGQKLEISAGGVTNATFSCNGAPGANGAAGDAAKITVTDEPAGAHCAAGGKRVDSQVGNGAVTTSYVCNGEGVIAVAEAAGSHCANGGVKVSSPGGGVSYVCNGTNGSNGMNGSSVTVTNEPAGTNCANGGVKVTDGVTTEYLCNGTNGSNGTDGANGQGAAVSSEPAGVNCPTGGVKITTSGGTEYVCNGTNGQSVSVTNEPPGPNCPTGGVKVSGGGTTQYACNGTGGSVGNPLGINAGPDVMVSVGDTVTLAGSAGPGVIGVQWQQVLGPAVSLSDPSSLTPSFTAPAYTSQSQRALLFELRGSDGAVLSSDLVVIQLNYAPHKPDAAMSQAALDNDAITCRVPYEWPEQDGESLTYFFKWKKNGQPFLGAQNFPQISIVSASDTAVTDVFECVVAVTDGHVLVDSDPVQSQIFKFNGCQDPNKPYAIELFGPTPVCCGANQHNGGNYVCKDVGTCDTANGYHNGGAGICEYAPGCSPGFHVGDSAGTCVPNGTCLLNFHDGGDGSCVDVGMCATGFHDGGNGTCVLNGGCAAGFHNGGSGACVPGGKCSATFALQLDGTCAPGCPTGQHDGGKGACFSLELCDMGFHDDGMGVCVSDVMSPSCASGYMNDGSGACMDTGTCAAGFKFSSGACVPHTACGSGTHDDGTGTCRTDGALPACALSYHLVGGACVPDLYKVVAGGHHACAVTTRNGVYCWGRGLEGQLGNGTTNGSSVPQPVKGMQSGVVSLALGEFHSCALMLNGTVRCWGKNEHGQLGDGTTLNRLLPVKSKVSSVRLPQLRELTLSAGEEHTCALTSTQGPYCWGSGKGTLGGGLPFVQHTPAPVLNMPVALNSIVELVSGANHNCVRTFNKTVSCWGDSVSGQLGDGSLFNNTWPTVVKVGKDPGDPTLAAESLFAGASANHTFAMTLKPYGSNVLESAVGWGDNGFGQQGMGFSSVFVGFPSAAPLLYESGLPLSLKGLTGGRGHGCAIVGPAGALECWGSNLEGQLGYAPFTLDMQTNTLVPALDSRDARKPVQGLSSGVVAVSASAAFTCAVTDDGKKVRCWGTGPEGELGNGSNLPRGEPVMVEGL